MYETASLLTTVAVTIKISLKRNHTSNDLWGYFRHKYATAIVLYGSEVISGRNFHVPYNKFNKFIRLSRYLISVGNAC